MELTDKDGNVFGSGGLEITTSDGKPKIPVISTDITIGTTVITGGVSGRLLYDNAGVVGETGGINWNPITSTLLLFDTPFYSQAGNSSANTAFSITGTASSNYTIYSSRQFIFNTGQSMYFNTDTDGGSALDRAWYFAGARSGITGGRTYGALTVDSSGFPSFTLYNNDNGPRILLASNATSYFNGGNLIVGGNVDAGFKCDIIGSARVTSLKTADIFPASATISLWTNSLNATSRFYTTPVHQDGRISFNAIAGGSDYAIIRAWHTGSFGLGTGSSATNAALTVRGDTLLVGPSGALYFMNGTFGPNNVPYRLAISTTATTTSFYSGVGNNLTNIESTKFEYTATSHTFYTGTTAGNQANPNQYTPLTLSNLGNVGIGTITLGAATKLTIGGTQTASSAIARGDLINITLAAAANNDVLVGLDISPTYTNGAFTGLTNVDLRTKGAGVVIGSGYGYGALYGYANDGIVQVVDGGTSSLSGGTYASQIWLRPAGNSGGLNSNYWATLEQSTGGLFIQSGRYNSNIVIKTGRAGTSGNIYFNNAGGTMAMFFGATGNFAVATTTDTGYKFNVNGTGYFGSNLRVNGTITAATPTASSYICTTGLAANQSVVGGVDTVIDFVDVDDAYNWWDPTTKKFTPNIQGYYHIDFVVWFDAANLATAQYNTQIRKNGNTAIINQQPTVNSTTGQSLTISKVIYMNGTTDNLDFTVYQGTPSNKLLLTGANYSGTYFTAHLIAL